jgi:hypothetical protein
MNFPVVDLSEPSPVTIRLAALQAAALVHQGGAVGRGTMEDSATIRSAEAFARWIKDGRQ